MIDICFGFFCLEMIIYMCGLRKFFKGGSIVIWVCWGVRVVGDVCYIKKIV